MGSGKWLPTYTETLRGRRVIIIPDNDAAGEKHAEVVAGALAGVAAEARIVRLPGLPDKGDVSDWMATGGTAGQLRELIESTGGATRTTPQPVGVLASTVQPERVVWLWRGRLAAGKQTLLDGDPGLGKSTLSLDIAARITTGAVMPGEDTLRDPRGVVLLSAEDGAADTIVPRLVAAGADLERVFIMTGVLPVGGGAEDTATLQHIEAIEAAIRRHDAALLIVDPIMAYLGAETNAHRDQDVRRTLAPLSAMLDRTGCAGLLVRHLNKAVGGAAIYRGGGSIGIIGAARFGLLVARDPEGESACVVASVKCNIGKEPPSLRYGLESVNDSDCARVRWDDHPVAVTANELLSVGVIDSDSSERDEARAWLLSFLDAGPRPSPAVFAEGRKAGFSEATLKRARKGLGEQVAAEKTGFDGGWQWRLVESGQRDDATKGITKCEGAHTQNGDPLRGMVIPFERAEAWLQALLAGGSQTERGIFQRATNAGLSRRELEGAKSSLGIQLFEIPHKPGQWYWRLPSEPLSKGITKREEDHLMMNEPLRKYVIPFDDSSASDSASIALASDVAYALEQLRQFTPAEVAEFRALVAAAPDDDPNLAVDRAALAALGGEVAA